MLVIAKTKDKELGILLEMLNRHCLITGSTGSGKTRTLQVIAENLSRAGTPVFLADVKGDLSGLSRPGVSTDKIAKRCKSLGIKQFTFQNYPVRFWDVYGENGIPMRTTVEEMGPILIAKLLGLSEVQEGTLMQAFKISADLNCSLTSLADLKAVLEYVLENAKVLTKYGRISVTSVGAVQRALLSLEMEQGNLLFGVPLDINDLMTTPGGYGTINVLTADKLMQSSKMYAAVLLNLLTQLYAGLPEVGDLPKPKIVLCFDEAHLIFKDCSKVLLNKVEQVIRLVRSKGVGIIMITQSPNDLPSTILGQLNNKIQHRLNFYTPADFVAVKAAAKGMRSNAKIDTEKAICELGTGEILISCLDEKGIPNVVERALALPPSSNAAGITDTERQEIINKSPLLNKYSKTDVDKESTAAIIKREQPVQQYSKGREKESIPIGVQLFNSLIKSGSGKGFVGKLLKMI